MHKDKDIEAIWFDIIKRRSEEKEANKKEPKPCKKVELIDYYRNERSKYSYRK